jgi:hypothetical protein
VNTKTDSDNLLLGPALKLRQNAGHVRMPSARSKFPGRARRCPAGGGRSSTMMVRRPLPADPLEHSGEPRAARSLDRRRSRRHRGCPSIGRRKQESRCASNVRLTLFHFCGWPGAFVPITRSRSARPPARPSPARAQARAGDCAVNPASRDAASQNDRQFASLTLTRVRPAHDDQPQWRGACPW